MWAVVQAAVAIAADQVADHRQGAQSRNALLMPALAQRIDATRHILWLESRDFRNVLGSATAPMVVLLHRNVRFIACFGRSEFLNEPTARSAWESFRRIASRAPASRRCHAEVMAGSKRPRQRVDAAAESKDLRLRPTGSDPQASGPVQQFAARTSLSRPPRLTAVNPPLLGCLQAPDAGGAIHLPRPPWGT